MLTRLALIAIILLIPPTIVAQGILVEVLDTQVRTWDTTMHNPAMATTQENCNVFSNTAWCTGNTVTAGGDTTIGHFQVIAHIRMPDGRELTAECHYPNLHSFSQDSCMQPPNTKGRAQIDGHSIKLRLGKVPRPEYNKDGSPKEAPKVKYRWVKFSIQE